MLLISSHLYSFFSLNEVQIPLTLGEHVGRIEYHKISYMILLNCVPMKVNASYQS